VTYRATRDPPDAEIVIVAIREIPLRFPVYLVSARARVSRESNLSSLADRFPSMNLIFFSRLRCLMKVSRLSRSIRLSLVCLRGATRRRINDRYHARGRFIEKSITVSVWFYLSRSEGETLFAISVQGNN